MCHLNQNNLYEKALILMWFWFLCVFFVTCLWTIYKIIGILTQKIRFSYLKVVSRGCIFFGFQFFVKNEERDGFLHEEQLIVEEKMNLILTQNTSLWAPRVLLFFIIH